MKTLTEYELRAMCLPTGTVEYRVEAGVFVTPMAAEYLHDRGIRLVTAPKSAAVMPQSHSDGQPGSYRLLTGETVTVKPENMTHLRGNLLVPKSHPRILLRGKLDSLEARIMETQVTAEELGYPQIAAELDEVYQLTQQILGCEVKGTPLGSFTLMGMDSAGLRNASHHLRESVGIDHPVPHYSMGRLCVALCSLRTAVREVELTAVAAFEAAGESSRDDLIEALNRMSSCIYLIFCRKLAGKYMQGKKVNEFGK